MSWALLDAMGIYFTLSSECTNETSVTIVSILCLKELVRRGLQELTKGLRSRKGT